MKTIPKLLVSLILLSLPIVAQSPEKLPPSIRTTGEAVVTTQPDRAQIDIGVVTQANTSQSAATQNAEKLQKVLAQLRQLLGANANIKTISYSLTPDYRYPQGDGEPTITGYTASNVVRVTLDDLMQVGKVIDTATQSGANRVNSLQFMLRDERQVQAQALREATIKAREKADALASALSVKVVRILSAEESSPVVIPVRDVSFTRAEKASTPIEPGTIEVRATISLTVEIGQ